MKPLGRIKLTYLHTLWVKGLKFKIFCKIKCKVREKLKFSLFGWGGGGKAEGCEASRWSKTYLFVYVIDKRGYVSNFSQIKCKVREKLQFTLFGWGGEGEGKP